MKFFRQGQETSSCSSCSSWFALRQASEQLGGRRARHGIFPLRLQLRKWRQHEAAFAKARMRDRQGRGLNDSIVEQDQIQIKRARRAGGRPPAAPRLLDLHEDRQQRGRRQRRAPDRDGVQIRRLDIRNINRLGFDRRRNAKVVEVPPELIDGKGQMRVPIAKVRAKGDRDLGGLSQSSERRARRRRSRPRPSVARAGRRGRRESDRRSACARASRPE